MAEQNSGDPTSESSRGRIWDREVSSREKRVALAIFGATYAVLITAGVWWANHQGYGVVGYMGLIAVAFVAVWLIMLLFLVGVAVFDLVQRRNTPV